MLVNSDDERRINEILDMGINEVQNSNLILKSSIACINNNSEPSNSTTQRSSLINNNLNLNYNYNIVILTFIIFYLIQNNLKKNLL